MSNWSLLSEADEQKLLFQWAELQSGKYPELSVMYAIPNGGTRNIKEACNLKLQGVKPGVPDICLPVPRNGYGSLYIEMKRRKGGTVSDNQRMWINSLESFGNKAAICKGFEEAKEAVENYLKGK